MVGANDDRGQSFAQVYCRHIFIPCLFLQRKLERVPLGDKLAAIGGILGLFLGFSFLTLLDLLFWVVDSCRGMVRKGGKNKSQDGKKNRETKDREVSSFK